MRLLLTRAPEDAARTRRRLEAAGHEVLLAPVIRIAPLVARWPDGAVDAVVAASAHAISALADGPRPSREARRLLPLLLVGARTLEGARARGFCGEALVTADAVTLADALARRGRLTRVVYLAGRDRKEDIGRVLDTIAAEVAIVETYRAEAADALPAHLVSALQARDGVLHYSRRSAELFIALAERHDLRIEALRHYCLSADTAEPLRAAGCRQVSAPEVPSEEALLALLAVGQA